MGILERIRASLGFGKKAKKGEEEREKERFLVVPERKTENPKKKLLKLIIERCEMDIHTTNVEREIKKLQNMLTKREIGDINVWLLPKKHELAEHFVDARRIPKLAKKLGEDVVVMHYGRHFLIVSPGNLNNLEGFEKLSLPLKDSKVARLERRLRIAKSLKTGAKRVKEAVLGKFSFARRLPKVERKGKKPLPEKG